MIRRRFTFRAMASGDLEAIDSDRGVWRCRSGKPSFDLIPDGGRFPSGWVLFDARLVRHAADFTARLCVDLGDGYLDDQAICPPVTRRGVLHELVWLPKGIRRMRWEPMQQPGGFLQSQLSMTEVSLIERLLRQWRRIVPAFFLHSLEKLARVGVTPLRAIFLPRQAYTDIGRLRAYAPELPYAQWIKRFDSLNEPDRREIRGHLGEMHKRPLISIVLPVCDPPLRYLQEAIESVRRQIYPNWELCIADDASKDPAIRLLIEGQARDDHRIRAVFREVNGHISAASNSALELATGEYVAFLDHDDLLAPHALYMVACEIERHPRSAIIYTDEDKIDESGERYDPHFKSDWNPQLFFGQNFIGHLSVYRADLLARLGGFRQGFDGAQDYDLALRVTELVRTEEIRHVPSVLYHWRSVSGSTARAGSEKRYAWEAGRLAIVDALSRRGVKASVSDLPGTPYYRVRYDVRGAMPLVSIIVSMRNRHELTKACVESVRRKSLYRRFEILLVDNQSDELSAKHFLERVEEQGDVRLLRFDAPFNYSAINNFAARHAKGDVFCFLNNDTEVVAPEWMEEMLAYVMQDEIGVVGAKLLFPDGLVQHAGVLMNVSGVAAHAHAFATSDSPGYFGRAQLAQDYMAVTGACMMVRRSVFEGLGGLDEVNLPVAFNDVDFCLRAREAGWRVVYAPHAVLIHHESASRGTDMAPETKARFDGEKAYMYRRWVNKLHGDPFYNPNLSQERSDFSLSNAPVPARPWRDRFGVRSPDGQ